MIMVIAILAGAAVGYVAFLCGRWYERRRLSCLIAWACQLAADLDTSMCLLEASERRGAQAEHSEMRLN
jgi:hypothetical protein